MSKNQKPKPDTIARYSRTAPPLSEASASLICMRKTRDGYRAKGLNQRGLPYKYAGAVKNMRTFKKKPRNPPPNPAPLR